MAIQTANYSPVAGRSYIELTSWAGSFGFAATPAAGMQIEYPDALTVNADGSHSGPDGSYTVRLIQANGSIEAITETITSSDVTAPTLSTPTLTATGASTASGTVNTNESGGNLYRWVTQNAVESRVDVLANGTPQPVTASGDQNITASGLTPTTTYYAHYVHVDAAGNQSSVVTSAAVTLPAASVIRQIDYLPGTGWAYVTLGVGYDRYIFREWATDPDDPNDPGYPLPGDQVAFRPVDFSLTEMAVLTSENEGTFNAVFVEAATGQMTAIQVYTTGLVAFNATYPQELVTIESQTVTANTATFELAYPGTDATGFEYTIDGGVTWTSTTSLLQLTRLQSSYPYTMSVRAVNADGPGASTTVDFFTASPADATPNAISFAAQTNVARSVTVTSAPITVTGVDAGVDVPVSVSGDTGSQYSVSTDGGATYGGWTSSPTNVRLNYRIRVRHTSSSEYSSGGYDGVRETTLNLNGVTGTFRSTTLADTTPPVISLTGGNLNWTQGTPWVEPGYSAIDNADGDISVTGVEIIGTPDVNTLGPQQILYRATDASGNVSESTRTVTIVESTPDDQTAPTITLTGGNRTLTVGETWNDPGFSATDETDGDLTDQVVVTGAVNTAQAGTYTLTYSVTDAAGNTGTATRTVTVRPAIQYPLDVNAPAKRTFVANRLLKFTASEPLFFMQSGEILDYDFDLTDWLAEQGGDIAEGTHEITEIAEALVVLVSGHVPGTGRVKVWLEAGKVTDSQSSLVQLKVSTTGYRTGVFQFRVVIINRMQ